MTSIHSSRSSHREALIEHLVTADLLEVLWRKQVWMEVLKPQVDDQGYDLVLEANGVIRHVQLKSSFQGSTVTKVNINSLLAHKPSGCVVFVRFNEETLERQYRFFGGKPLRPLGDLSRFKVGKHTKANAQGVKGERPNIRTVPLSQFDPACTCDELALKLFGKAPQPVR